MEDSYKYKGLRKQLVDSLRYKGITSTEVLRAIERVPRHFFFDSSFLAFAYEDKPFPIGAGQTISQPYTVAFQSELLNFKKGDKVLEVGTGSGYQASILVEMGAKVFSVERQRSLYKKTKKLLNNIGYKVRCYYGDGYKGLPGYAPFQSIIVTAGAPYIPQALLEQLSVNGTLVIPVGDTIQTMTTVKRISETEYLREEHGQFRFVPLLEDLDSGNDNGFTKFRT